MHNTTRYLLIAGVCVSALFSQSYEPSFQKDNRFIRTVAFFAPLTTDVLQGDNASDDFIMEIRPAGTIAALTVNLEVQNGDKIGTEVELCFSQVVTALTVNGSAAGGATFVGTVPTAATISTTGCVKFYKVSLGTGSGGVWRRND